MGVLATGPKPEIQPNYGSARDNHPAGYVQSLRIGQATITLINVGDFRISLAQWLRLPEGDGALASSDLFQRRLWLPIRCVHIRLPEASILVDASVYDVPAGSPYELPGYQPPPGLLAQLSRAGISPETVDHVIFTHAHTDHINGATAPSDGEGRPCFPRARHHLGRADWEGGVVQDALKNPDSREARSLGVLDRCGALDLVDGDRSVSAGVRIIAAPGESPGHQIVRVHSEGQTLYCLGDLYHHPVEVERPDWMTARADPNSNLASRRALVEAALREQALLVPSHFVTPGYIGRRQYGTAWVPAFAG